MPYRINGNALTEPKDMAPGEGIFATGPNRHSIETSPVAVVQTVGGAVAVEPPTGLVRTHEWQFDERTAEAVRVIRSYMVGSPLCYIDTYDVEADPLSPTKSMKQLTNILCVGTITTVSSAGRRDRVDNMSIVWREVFPQTGV
jgi:hypothetical protein